MDVFIEEIKILHRMSKAAKAGDKVICPGCLDVFEKKKDHHVFCKGDSKRCADWYWNIVKDWGD